MFHYTVGANANGFVTACGETMAEAKRILPGDKKCPDCVLVLDLCVELEATVVRQA